jgi:hypothetical protein
VSNEAPEAPQQPICPPPVEPPPPVVVENKPVEGATAPSAGRRPSFRDLHRQLTDEEMKQSGVQKLLIEDIERMEADCDTLQDYVEKYYVADKQVGILTEKLRTETALDIITSVGWLAGGALMSLSYSLWSITTFKGVVVFVAGFVLAAGSYMAKWIRRR